MLHNEKHIMTSVFKGARMSMAKEAEAWAILWPHMKAKEMG